MVAQVDWEFDLFVLYANTDAAWVSGYLLPALSLPSQRVISEDHFGLGHSRVEELAHAVEVSRFTVVVLSPAFLADKWAAFGQHLAAHLGIAERRDRLIPALLRPCELPLDLAFRVPLDYTRESDWDAETARLRAEIGRTPPEAPTEQVLCPYPGLIPYTQAQAELFFGRDAEIRELLRRVLHLHLAIVIGPSGSGKSSLVFAGLVPELHRRWPNEWLVRTVRPGADPLRALRSALECAPDDTHPQRDPASAVAALLDRHPPARRLLLVIDQFEEALSQALAPDREAFVAIMATLRGVQASVAVLTLRADFYPELMQSDLWPVDEAERLEVVPLRGAALHEAIEQPARQRGVYLEAALVDRLVADAAREPGVLPLLQETLRQLWGEMRQRLLTVGAYEALGREGDSGMAVALATWADASLAELPPGQRMVARRVFLRLVHLGEGRDDTRREQSVAALRVAGEDPVLFERTLRLLTERRLLTRSGHEGEGQAVVDLAHEALIGSWPTLRRWVTEGREGELYRRRIERDAGEWQQAHRSRSLLYRGRGLKNAREWRERYPHEPSPSVLAFLAAGRRLNIALKTLAVLVVGVVAVATARLAIPVVEKAYLRHSAMAASPMVFFAAGPAVLGGLGETGPRARQIRILLAFSIDRHEVTYRQYRLCVRADSCLPPLEPAQFTGYDGADPDLPVVYVTAYQAADFCRWLGRRLPSGAEWERAARGTEGRPWPWGTADPAPRYANAVFNKKLKPALARVDDRRFAAGATTEGVAGLIGNAAEWTSNSNSCANSPYDCRHPWNGRVMVDTLEVRGSSYFSSVDPVTSFVPEEPLLATEEVGFRCAQSD
jgi:formylglycine-generating enzyme required for sulfatase activity